MSQMVGPCPLQEFNLRPYIRARPNTFLRLLRREPLTHRPAASSGRLEKGHFVVFRCLIRSKPHAVAGTRLALTRAA
jgi:hypothetical protein